jgi:hypothetical protein
MTEAHAVEELEDVSRYDAKLAWHEFEHVRRQRIVGKDFGQRHRLDVEVRDLCRSAVGRKDT